MLQQSIASSFKLFILFSIASIALGGYDTLLAKKMVYLSNIAYEDPSNITNWSCQTCKNITVHRPIVIDQKPDLQAFVGLMEIDMAIVVVFRGTDDARNWMTDFDGIKTDYPLCDGCKVHRGFYDSYQTLAPKIHQIYQKFRAMYPTFDVQITGHSLGGALASLCAQDFKKTYNVNPKVYTYGEPRVGNAQYAAFAEKQVPELYRVIDYEDVVPHSPPQYMGFKHQGLQEWYNPAGMQTYVQCAAEDPSCSDSVRDFRFSASDHHIKKYMQLKVQGPVSGIRLFKRNLRAFE